MRRLVTTNGRQLQTAICALALLTGACSRDAAYVPPSNPFDEPSTFTVLNGWTRVPVAGAAVRANGTELLTDGGGQVRLRLTGGGCLAVEVIAAGFLERGTCAAPEITLWPVDDEAERAATRAVAFYNDRLPQSLRTDVTLRPALGAENAAAWAAAAEELQRISQSYYTFRFTDQSPFTNMIVNTGPPSDCLWGWWPVEIAGFCMIETAPYDYEMMVPPERLGDRSIAQRALLSMTWPVHSMPGLLNKTRPDAELSAFERKTLHMMGLRKLSPVTWPDFDPPR